jgi:hypothetical protein
MLPGVTLGVTLGLAALAGCNTGARECGPGTEQVSGACVVVADDVRCGDGTAIDEDTGECHALVACGEGTVLDEVTGTCAPVSECGPGTYFDLAKGECAPEQHCGPGTSFDEATGTCEPAVFCGAGTHDDGEGSCVPDEPCQDGAVRDEATGLCVSDLSCGSGQIVVANQCVDPAGGLALEADALESFPDANDPASGGAPEVIALEGMGEQTIFVGTIGRPADLAGNGTLTQDRDVWRFSGTAGARLNISVHDTGLPQPAFVLEGPDGYRRTSAIGLGSVATRDVVLPYDGDYTLVVVPSSWLSTEVPLGDPAAGYVGVIEVLPLPPQAAVTPGASFDAPVTVTGALLDFEANVLNVQTTAGTAFQLTYRSVGADVVPAAVAFSSGLELLGHVQNLEEGGWMGVFVATGDRATVVLDWEEAAGLDDAYEVDLFEVPLIDRGAIPGDFHTVTASHDLVPGYSTAAFSFSVDTDQVALADIGGTGVYNPDVQVTGPGGTRADIRDEDDFFFFAEPGAYVLFVHNDSANDDSGVSLQLQLRTAHDLGALAPGDLAEVAGDDLVYGFDGFPDAWAVATLTSPGLLELAVTASHGDPDLYVYGMSGELLRARHRPHLDRPASALIGDARPVLIRLDADDHNLLDWTIAARAAELPASLDVEPNDTRARAVPLGVAPLRASGVIDDDEVDVYSFELAAPLAEGEAIAVVFDNLAGDSAYGSVTDGAFVVVRDDTFGPLASVPGTDSSPGVLGPNSVTLVPAYEGAGPFYLEILGDHITERSDYLIDISVVPLAGEVEPNDAIADADDIGPLPASVFGYRGADGGDDLWRVVLDAPLASDESLRVVARNLESNTALALTLEDAAGNASLGISRALGELALADLDAGEHFVRVSGATSSDSPYRLDVQLGGPVEREPNNSPLAPQDLGVISPDGWRLTGYSSTADDDIYGFELDAPLAADESLRLQVVNVDDSSRNVIELYEVSTGTPVLVAHDKGAFGDVLFARPGATGPFGLRVAGASSALDRYLVRVDRAGPAEQEPNDTQSDATPVAVPGRVLGSVGGGEVDVFAVTLDSALNIGQSLRARMENESDGSSIRVALRGSTFGSVLSEGTGFRVTASAQLLPAGTYYVEVEGTGTAGSESDVYSIELEVQ